LDLGLFLGGIVVRIRRARVFRVGLARVADADGRYVVDVLERAPQPLRPILRLDGDVQADQRDIAFGASRPSRRQTLGDVDDFSVPDYKKALPHGWRISLGEDAPRRLYRNRSDGELRRRFRRRQQIAMEPAVIDD